jgi:8-hydroxy-5-deazaflavin:NADPH oxidoreductase
MRIAIIGAGNVGGTLGRAWAQHDHQVMYGVREPGRAKTAPAVSVPEAAKFAEVVVLATPWNATEEAIRNCGDLTGKILLDCTNPLKPDLSGLAVGHTSSAGEQVAQWARGALVVKIFNTTGFPNMADPKYGSEAATMFYAGDDAGAKAAAAQLAREIGFDPVDAGPLANARLLEPLAMLWIYMAVVQGQGVNMAFRLMRR